MTYVAVVDVNITLKVDVEVMLIAGTGYFVEQNATTTGLTERGANAA